MQPFPPVIPQPRPLSRREFVGLSSFAAAGLAARGATPASRPESADAPEPGAWADADAIVARLREPVFLPQRYLVTEYGARPGGDFDSRPAFQTTIERCTAAGGGTIIVPAGEWRLDGPLHLKSNVNLHLEKDSRLRFSANADHYLPLVLTRWEGTELFNYSPPIYAYQAANVAITGPGVIDGNGAAMIEGWREKQGPAQRRLRELGGKGAPVYERVFGRDNWLRPPLVQFFGCTGLLVEGVTLVDAPFWCLHASACHNVIVRGLSADSLRINNDGFDVESCSDVLIEDCDFKCGDDCIALKSGRDQDGWRLGRPTENVVIRRVRMEAPTAGSGLAAGSEMSGGVRNIFAEDIRMGYARTAINIKGNLDRGGSVEGVRLRRISIERADIALQFTTAYHGYRGGQRPPVFRDFVVEDVRCGEAQIPVSAVGVPSALLTRIVLRRIAVERAERPPVIEHVSQFGLEDVRINGRPVTMPVSTN